MITPGQADVCDADPGYPVSVTVTASLGAICRVWRGDLGWAQAMRSGAVHLQGPETLRRALPSWFKLSAFAAVLRPAQR